MAEPKLTVEHLIAPRKLILLVRMTAKGTYEAVTLSGEVALTGATRDEVKDKMRAQVKAMDSQVRPTTVRMHFLEESRTWIMAPTDDDGDNSGDKGKGKAKVSESNGKEKPEDDTKKGKSAKK